MLTARNGSLGLGMPVVETHPRREYQAPPVPTSSATPAASARLSQCCRSRDSENWTTTPGTTCLRWPERSGCAKTDPRTDGFGHLHQEWVKQGFDAPPFDVEIGYLPSGTLIDIFDDRYQHIGVRGKTAARREALWRLMGPALDSAPTQVPARRIYWLLIAMINQQQTD